jgi:hypothetical protein
MQPPRPYNIRYSDRELASSLQAYAAAFGLSPSFVALMLLRHVFATMPRDAIEELIDQNKVVARARSPHVDQFTLFRFWLEERRSYAPGSARTVSSLMRVAHRDFAPNGTLDIPRWLLAAPHDQALGSRQAVKKLWHAFLEEEGERLRELQLRA